MIPANIGEKASQCHAASAGVRRRRRRGVDVISRKSISLIRMIPFFVDTLLQHVYQVSVLNYKPQARRIPVAESNLTLYTNSLWLAFPTLLWLLLRFRVEITQLTLCVSTIWRVVVMIKTLRITHKL